MSLEIYVLLKKYEITIVAGSCILLFLFLLMLFFIRRKRLTKCHKIKDFESIRSDTSQSKLFRCAETFKHVSKDVTRESTSSVPVMHPMSACDETLRMELNEHYTQSLSFDSSDTKIFKQTTKKPLLLRQSNLGSKRLLERRGSNISLSIKLTSASSFDSHFKRSICKSTLDIEYFDLATASNDLDIAALHERVNCLKDMDQEFNKIQTNAIYDLDIDGYYNKNRYSEVLPNKHTRVILPASSSDEHPDGGSTYINANYIKDMTGHDKVYIATQGPIASTVNDIWRMVWSDKCPVIVMITKLIENNQCKCADYIPCKVTRYGEFVVTVNSIIERESYSVREIVMTNERQEEHHLKHYWYTSWPDHGVPKHCAQILRCVAEVETDRLASQYSCTPSTPSTPAAAVAPGSDYRLAPIIVHCSAGIGRSGCFMAICMGINQLMTRKSVDVLAIVCSMRTDRGNLVQNISQYKFIHEALDAYAQTELNKSK